MTDIDLARKLCRALEYRLSDACHDHDTPEMHETYDMCVRANDALDRATLDTTIALGALDRLATGGSLVCTSTLTEAEIAIARAGDRLYVLSSGIGYVWRMR